MIFIITITGIVVAGFLAWIQFFGKKRHLDRQVYQEYWSKIEDCLSDQTKYQLAIIEADKLLDKAFKERGLKGKTMGERLVYASRYLSHKDEVWRVHKLRNRLVHETGVSLNLKQTRWALDVFAQALKDMGAF